MLPPRLLIIHPAQLGIADKSHEIAFVLQLDDLRFTVVPFSCTLLTSCPPYLLLEQQRGFWGTLWAGHSQIRKRLMQVDGEVQPGPCWTSLSTKESCSAHRPPCLAGDMSSRQEALLVPGYSIISLCHSQDPSQQQRKAQCSCRASGRKGISPCPTQTPLMPMANSPS